MYCHSRAKTKKKQTTLHLAISGTNYEIETYLLINGRTLMATLMLSVVAIPTITSCKRRKRKPDYMKTVPCRILKSLPFVRLVSDWLFFHHQLPTAASSFYRIIWLALYVDQSLRLFYQVHKLRVAIWRTSQWSVISVLCFILVENRNK